MEEDVKLFFLADLKSKVIISPKVTLMLQKLKYAVHGKLCKGLKEESHCYHQINTWTSVELFGNQSA